MLHRISRHLMVTDLVNGKVIKKHIMVKVNYHLTGLNDLRILVLHGIYLKNSLKRDSRKLSFIKMAQAIPMHQ